MLTEHQEEQASLYALDLLDSHEVTSFQREMLAKPELQLLVEDLRLCRDVVALESPAPPPPAHLKEKILAGVATTNAAKALSQAGLSSEKKPAEKIALSRLIVPWALAACLTVLAGWLSNDRQKMLQQVVNLEEEILQLDRTTTSLKNQNASQTKTIAQLESQNLIQASTIAQLKTTSAQANAWTQSAVSVVWDKKRQEGVLVLSKMPAAEAGKIYQLWVIDPEAQGPVSAGTFEVQADGSARILFRPTRQVRQAAQFAVSLEEGGEKQQPEGPVILAGTSL
jgi:hypothetical protein